MKRGQFPPFLPPFISPHLLFSFSPFSFYFFLIWIPSQTCQGYFRFAPNQTQTTAATGNREKFTKNLTDQQNTPPSPFSVHGESVNLARGRRGLYLGWEKF